MSAKWCEIERLQESKAPSEIPQRIFAARGQRKAPVAATAAAVIAAVEVAAGRVVAAVDDVAAEYAVDAVEIAVADIVADTAVGAVAVPSEPPPHGASAGIAGAEGGTGARASQPGGAALQVLGWLAPGFGIGQGSAPGAGIGVGAGVGAGAGAEYSEIEEGIADGHAIEQLSLHKVVEERAEPRARA